jgi:hypothetical protein
MLLIGIASIMIIQITLLAILTGFNVVKMMGVITDANYA